jgi:N-acetylmuramoyl-L-alanine amidase
MRKDSRFSLTLVVMLCLLPGGLLHAGKSIILRNSANARTVEVPVVSLESGDYAAVAELGRACKFLYEFDRVTRKALLQNDANFGQLMPDNEYLSFGMDVARCARPPVMSGGGICIAVEDTDRLLKGLGLDNWGYDVREKAPEPEAPPAAPAIVADNGGTVEDVIRPAGETRQPDIAPVTGEFPAAGDDEFRNQLRFIILDPGHGGTDPGGIGLTGLREKAVVLKVGLMVKALLEEQVPGVRIVLTRDRNDFVPLDGRSRIANEELKALKNGLFISIHANISRNKQTSGVETYYLSDNPSDDEARAVAAMENGVIESDAASSGIVNRLLSSMLDAELIRQSRMLAEALNGGFNANLGTFTGSRGLKTARFRVLEGTMMPSVLTEIGFLSNAREERLLRDDEYLARVALAIADGIVGFVRQYNRHNGFTLKTVERLTSDV